MFKIKKIDVFIVYNIMFKVFITIKFNIFFRKIQKFKSLKSDQKVFKTRKWFYDIKMKCFKTFENYINQVYIRILYCLMY